MTNDPPNLASPPRRAAVYLRVSGSSQSVEAQRLEVEDYLRRRGDGFEAVFYEETACSVDRKRPVFREMYTALKRREFGLLLVSRLDRVGRRLSDLVVFLEELRELNVTFVSVHEGHDTGTAAGSVILQIAGVFAEYERALLRERTCAGMRAARERGSKIGRPPTTRTQLTDDAVRAAVAKEGSLAAAARSLGVSGWSVRMAWRRMNPVAAAS